MKKIYEMLSGIGLTVSDEQKKDFEKTFKETYTAKAEFDRLTAEKDNYKTQLDTAKESLKAFEGVDVADMKNKIITLTNDLAAKETEYNTKIAERDFNDLLGKYAGEFKARDVKAVMPFLDVEKLRQSKNQNDDMKAAFEAVKKDRSYLFEDDAVPRVVSFTAGPNTNTNDAKTKANEALRSFLRKE